MSSYDPYDAPIRERERTSKRYYREERRGDDRDSRYESRDSGGYLSPVSHDLVPRAREDSDLSVEEIRREFPPPGYSDRDIRRARSAGGGGYYDDYYDNRRGHDRDYEPRSSRKSESYYYEEEKKARVLSKQEQIFAAIAGAALAVGSKELYDRRDAKLHDSDIQRNVLASAALGAAGALAGYSGTELYNKHKEKDDRKSLAQSHRGRGYDSSDDEDGKEKKGNKNFLEGLLGAIGGAGALKALTGGKDDKSDTRSTRSRGGSDAGSKSGKNESVKKIQGAAMAALAAGATEAFRVAKEPGGWKGEKAKRVLTAAAGASGINAAQKDGTGKLGLAESIIGGLVGNRVINGSKKNIEEDEKTGRSRSRSRARSKGGDGGSGGVTGLAALATAGLGALGAKRIMDGRKDDDDDDSRSRRRRSVDSRDSRDGSPKRHRSRSRSVVDKARRGLAKLGLGNGPEEEDDRDHDRRDRSRRDYDDYDDQKSRRRRDSYDDNDRDRDYDRERDHRKSSKRDEYSDEERSHPRRDRQRNDRGTVARRGSHSSTDLGDTDEDEKHGKKMRDRRH